MSRMSSTTPYWSSTNTQSPTRSGCVTASMIPATKLASVWRAAKPRIAAAIAPEASSERGEPVDAVELRRARPRRRQDDDRVDEPADEAQPRVGLGRELAARDRLRRAGAAARERAVEHERDQQRDERSRRPRVIQAVVRTSQKPLGKIRSDMGGEVRRQAVLLDAMGTLLRLEDPAPRLRAALRARLGVDVGAAAAAAAIRAEIAFYRAHLHLGRDAASLAALRERCAEAMRPALPAGRWRPRRRQLTAALLEALAFSRLPGRARRRCGRCARPAARSSSSRTGTSRCTSGSPRPGWRRSSTAPSRRPSWARRSPTRAIFERALALAGARAAERLARRRQRRRRRRGRARGRDPAGPDRARRRTAPPPRRPAVPSHPAALDVLPDLG